MTVLDFARRELARLEGELRAVVELGGYSDEAVARRKEIRLAMAQLERVIASETRKAVA